MIYTPRLGVRTPRDPFWLRQAGCQITSQAGCHSFKFLLNSTPKDRATTGSMRLAFLHSTKCLLQARRNCCHQAFVRKGHRAMSASAEGAPGGSGQALAQKRCVPCEGDEEALRAMGLQCQSLSQDQIDSFLPQARLVDTRIEHR